MGYGRDVGRSGRATRGLERGIPTGAVLMVSLLGGVDLVGCDFRLFCIFAVNTVLSPRLGVC